MIWVILLSAFVYYSYRFLYGTPDDTEEHVERHVTTLPTIPPTPIPETFTLSPRHKEVAVVESVEWCNEITKICWPYIGKIVQAQLKPTVEPLINLYLPKPFSKFRFLSADLGRDPIRIDRVIVHRRYRNSIAMDLDVIFEGSPNMTMKCSPLSASFGIKKLEWKGRLAVLLRPLVPTLPLVGAIQASMITHPEFDMDFSGVANLAEIGPVFRVVKMVLGKVIASMLVLPNRFLYKVIDSIDYFDVYSPPLGVICFTIQRGRGFTKEKKIGMIKSVPDLYCKAVFALETMKTDVRMNDLTPEWSTSKSFILSDLDQPFELSCYDKDTITRDDLVGEITRTAKELLILRGGWMRLDKVREPKIGEHGEIFLSAQFFKFDDPRSQVKGLSVITVLIDRATGLPASTKEAACKVTVGNKSGKKEVRETPSVVEVNPPVPGVDPRNPTWNFSFDILVEDYLNSDVRLEVVDDRTTIGRVVINTSVVEASDTNCSAEEHALGQGMKLRAKVILRGLTPDSLNLSDASETPA